MKKNNKLDQAKKYVLCFDDVLYLSKHQNLTGINLTEDINEAQIFAYGFDNPEDKKFIWSYSLKRLMNNYSVSFTVKDI